MQFRSQPVQAKSILTVYKHQFNQRFPLILNERRKTNVRISTLECLAWTLIA